MAANDQLSEALARWESCLETPVVPGELLTWLDEAKHACDEVGAQLRPQLERTQPKLFQDIVGQDPSLVPRVEELKSEDQQLLDQMDRVRAHIEQLRNRASQLQPPESKIDRIVATLSQEALSLVISVRKQEKAITTWYLESFDRERGVAD